MRRLYFAVAIAVALTHPQLSAQSDDTLMTEIYLDVVEPCFRDLTDNIIESNPGLNDQDERATLLEIIALLEKPLGDAMRDILVEVRGKSDTERKLIYAIHQAACSGLGGLIFPDLSD